MEENKEKKLEPIVKTKKKKSLLLAGEGNTKKTLTSYILERGRNILVDTIEDFVVNGIHILLRGEPAGVRRTNTRTYNGTPVYTQQPRVNYAAISTGQAAPAPRRRAVSRGLTAYEDIRFETRADAEKVLNSMTDYIEEFKVISVGDFMGLVGQDTDHTDFNFGWNDLSIACIKRAMDGFYIDFPEPRAIK